MVILSQAVQYECLSYAYASRLDNTLTVSVMSCESRTATNKLLRRYVIVCTTVYVFPYVFYLVAHLLL